MPRRATFPKGKAGRSCAVHRICKAQAAVKPAGGGLPSSVTVRRVPHCATFPKGKAGRSCAVYRISRGEHKEPRLVRIFAPCGYFYENLYKKQPAAFRKGTKRKQRAVRSWVFGENARHGSAKDADFSPTYG